MYVCMYVQCSYELITRVPGTIIDGDLGNRAAVLVEEGKRLLGSMMISSGAAEYDDDEEEVDADYASGLMATSPPSIFLNHLDQILSAQSKQFLYLAAVVVWFLLSLLLLELWYGGFDESFAPIVAGETIFDMGLKCFLLIYSMCYFGICIQQLIQKIQSPRRRTHHPPLRVCGLPRNALVCFFILPIVLAHTDWLSIFLIRRSGAATAIGIPSSARTYEIEYPEAVQQFQKYLWQEIFMQWPHFISTTFSLHSTIRNFKSRSSVYGSGGFYHSYLCFGRLDSSLAPSLLDRSLPYCGRFVFAKPFQTGPLIRMIGSILREWSP